MVSPVAGSTRSGKIRLPLPPRTPRNPTNTVGNGTGVDSQPQPGSKASSKAAPKSKATPKTGGRKATKAKVKVIQAPTPAAAISEPEVLTAPEQSQEAEAILQETPVQNQPHHAPESPSLGGSEPSTRPSAGATLYDRPPPPSGNRDYVALGLGGPSRHSLDSNDEDELQRGQLAISIEGDDRSLRQQTSATRTRPHTGYSLPFFRPRREAAKANRRNPDPPGGASSPGYSESGDESAPDRGSNASDMGFLQGEYLWGLLDEFEAVFLVIILIIGTCFAWYCTVYGDETVEMLALGWENYWRRFKYGDTTAYLKGTRYDPRR